MRYSHDIEKSKGFATQAIKKMAEIGLAPTPDHYELWYVYYAEMNADIIRAIDILEASGQTVTMAQCQELYLRFLSEGSQDEEVRKVGDQIHDTIRDVADVVTFVKDATHEYNDSLSEASQQLSQTMSKDEIEAVLRHVATTTQDMMTKNSALEAKLNESSQAMEKFQKDLESARKEALVDGLTGLANRKAFDAELERVIEAVEESGQEFTLAIMDIDHFKSFNDNYGHQVGDQVLRLVARTMIESVKGRDMAARYGGEEFVLILPETMIDGAMKVSDYLRNAVANKEIVNRNSGEKLGRITLSGGVAQYVPGESAEDLIQRADCALYTAKHNGRNQIVAAPVPGQKAST